MTTICIACDLSYWTSRPFGAPLPYYPFDPGQAADASTAWITALSIGDRSSLGLAAASLIATDQLIRSSDAQPLESDLLGASSRSRRCC